MCISQTDCEEHYRCHSNSEHDIALVGYAYDITPVQGNLSECILQSANIALYICFEPRYMTRMIEEWRNSFQKNSLTH